MRTLAFIALFLGTLGPISIRAADDNDALQNVKSDTDAIWAGNGAQDSTFSAVSISMLGWSIGLAGGIAILASAINQSASDNESSSCSH